MFQELFLNLLLSQFSITFCILRELTNLDFAPTGRTSGIAVSDLDNDGTFEVIVSVLDGPNKILKYDKRTAKYYDVSRLHPKYNVTRDRTGRTISVCTCDMDGDGTEEIYLHNHNDVYPATTSVSVVPDKLFKVVDGEYIDLFHLTEEHRALAPRYGGNSVACIDRTRSGMYDIIVTTFTEDGKGTYKVLSAQQKYNERQGSSQHVLSEISQIIGLNMERDGRGILVGPILSNEYSSNIFITNDNSYHTGSYVTRHDGRNVLLKNNGDGTFQDVATELGVADRNYNGRGSGMLDFNADSKLDIALTNWLGPSRTFQQQDDNNRMQFQETEESLFSHSTASAALLTCDFDNDGQADILKSGANGDMNWPKYNEIFTIISRKKSTDEKIKKTELADYENFKRLRMRGIAVADLNGDGILELFVSHDKYKNRTFSVFQNEINTFDWIRFVPLTKYGSSARGSLVTLTLESDEERRVVIGGDCSFMCQSEPVAHFGIGNATVKQVEVIWPDGRTFRKYLYKEDIRKTLVITYSGNVTYRNLETLSDAKVSAACLFKAYLYVWFIYLYFILNRLCTGAYNR